MKLSEKIPKVTKFNPATESISNTAHLKKQQQKVPKLTNN